MKYILALLLTISTAAHAQFRDGNRLLSDMNGASGSHEKSLALGYIMGVADAYNKIAFCPPGNVTAGQFFDLTKQFLEAYPGQRHRAADMIIGDIGGKIWACPKTGRQL